jgi:hypothetical protein
MEFDELSVVLLVTPPDPPKLDEEAAGALQDRHLDHLARLHEAGHLVAAGPLLDPDRRLRGLSLFRGNVAQTRALAEQDPAVEAGVFAIEVVPWMVPGGALAYYETRFPHSRADVDR